MAFSYMLTRARLASGFRLLGPLTYESPVNMYSSLSLEPRSSAFGLGHGQVLVIARKRQIREYRVAIGG